jgi:hypothetical protein
MRNEDTRNETDDPELELHPTRRDLTRRDLTRRDLTHRDPTHRDSTHRGKTRVGVGVSRNRKVSETASERHLARIKYDKRKCRCMGTYYISYGRHYSGLDLAVVLRYLQIEIQRF